MEIADRQFGADDWSLRRLTDRAGVLRHEDRERVQLAMGRFSKRFPQLFVAIYTGNPGTLEDLRGFSFWLLNRAAFDDVPVDMPNEAGILITIDPEHRAACITYGYLLDEHLDEILTFDCLCRAHGHWLEERYADGIVRVLDQLERVLIGLSCKARRRAKRGERSADSVQPQLVDEVRPLRDGHRPMDREEDLS
ncbi:MAG: hypothetical protein R3242_10735 [Akkermansiaceae bacterium]|nr:hypothetical protein [Akkermansiaceae bacterium]